MTSDQSAPSGEEAAAEPLFRDLTEEDVWGLVSTIFDMPETAEKSGLYWHDAMQGSALLMAALHILAEEFHNHVEEADQPTLVRAIVKMTMSRREKIREIIWQALL